MEGRYAPRVPLHQFIFILIFSIHPFSYVLAIALRVDRLLAHYVFNFLIEVIRYGRRSGTV